MRLLALLGCLVMPACATLRPPSVPTDTVALSSVHRLFLGDFGSQESSSLVKEKVRLLLLNSTRFQLVEREELADAVLTGSVGVSHSLEDGTSSYSGSGLLRLVRRSDGRTIWAHQHRASLTLTASASSRVANQMVAQLHEAAAVP